MGLLGISSFITRVQADRSRFNVLQITLSRDLHRLKVRFCFPLKEMDDGVFHSERLGWFGFSGLIMRNGR